MIFVYRRAYNLYRETTAIKPTAVHWKTRYQQTMQPQYRTAMAASNPATKLSYR
jgi:hypothetical protein